jgi:Zn-dependent M28 family amino/carboxypeptidase
MIRLPDFVSRPSLVLLCATACAGERALDTAAATITETDLATRIEVLADDSMLGRAPASLGEERTLRYLQEQFRAVGLEPGNGARYLQEVPLVSIAADPTMTLTIRGRGTVNRFAYATEFMGWTKRVTPRVELQNSEMVFVGYGIVAPKYDWNDYEGVDVRGKTVVMLVNDPGFATQDTALFTGNAMTYYGRWSYKYEEAARQGAAGAIIVHETAPAGYPWSVVSGSWSGAQFDLVRPDSNMSRVRLEGWVTLETATTIFRQSGLSYEELKHGAVRRDFQAVPMALTASATVRNTIARSTSNNVLGLLRGTARPDEAVIYMAHWDHLGVDPTLEGDSVYNGAVDNASGTAGILEIAQAFTALPTPPERSLLFIALAAEEQGLLGSAYYTEHPVFPLSKTVAALNVDILNVWGATTDVTLVGHGNSELDAYVERHAARQGRTVHGDAEPQKGFYFRSDHFNFAKRGVPSAWLEVGADHPTNGPGWVRQHRAAYDEERYHTPEDEVQASWDLAGGIQDLQLAFRVGYQLARDTTFPAWNPGTPFKAVRDSMRR